MKESIAVKEFLDKEGYIIHRIKGVSMLPMLEEGSDLVKLEAVKEKDKLKQFDLILFEREGDGALVLHRIIKVKKKYYITYGDNCVNYEVVPFDSVLALAVGFYKKEKYVSCDNPQYLEYVEKRCSCIKNREIYKKQRLEDEQRAQHIKERSFIRKIFPSKRFMKQAFPLLTIYPVLLPYFWFVRLIRGIKRQITKK
ncbi:MAG: S26 family signal peptidase [Ruminococcaceae bacterium]|nr:S26 family signal peptidase [Oscillospiraceae bacterium]